MARGRGRGGRRGGGRGGRGSSSKPSSTAYVVVKKVSKPAKGGKSQTPKGKSGGVHKKKTPVGKRGGSRGRGRGRGRGGDDAKKKTAEQLDAEMDAYFMKDEKTAAQRLNTDLDDYWKNKPAEDEEMAS